MLRTIQSHLVHISGGASAGGAGGGTPHPTISVRELEANIAAHRAVEEAEAKKSDAQVKARLKKKAIKSASSRALAANAFGVSAAKKV